MKKYQLLREEASCDGTTYNAEAGGSRVRVQPRLHGKILFGKRVEVAAQWPQMLRTFP